MQPPSCSADASVVQQQQQRCCRCCCCCCCGEGRGGTDSYNTPNFRSASAAEKRGPELQLRNTMGWRPSIMLRTSDVNCGGVPPARVSTQIPLYVPCTHARAAHPGGQAGTDGVVPCCEECVTAVRTDIWQQEDARQGPGYPNVAVTAEPSTVHSPARPARDDVAETATRGLLAKPQASLVSCCQCTPPHKFRPEIFVLHCTRNSGPSIVPS